VAGPKFFGVDIQAQVASAFGTTGLPAMTYVKVTPGTQDPTHLTIAPTPTYTSVPVFGAPPAVDHENVFDASQVDGAYSVIRVIAKPLEDLGIEPATDDLVDYLGQTYTVVRVKTDSARAMHVLAVRGRDP
jgi:hypothetical protein